MQHIREAIKKLPTGDGGRALGRDGWTAAARPYVQDITLSGPRQGVSIPIFVRGNKLVGVVRGDTFYKVVRASRHLLRKPQAWCFSLATLHQAARLGAVAVQVCDAETGRVYRASLRDIWTRGFPVTYDPDDDQIALALEHWEVSGGGEARQLTLGEDNSNEQ